MTITIDAIYEDGVLKPSQPLPLSEHEQVRVTVEPQVAGAGIQQPGAGAAPAQGSHSAVERIIARAEALPAETVAQWPTDGASQHDHYIYGTPKRLDLRDNPE